MANTISSSSPRPLSQSNKADVEQERTEQQPKLNLDLPAEKPSGWSPETKTASESPVPYSKKVDLTGDFALGVIGGAWGDRRRADAAGQPANQSVKNLLPNMSDPRADFSGYGLGAGGHSLSSPEGQASVAHNAVHIGVGAGVYLFERARGASKTEAALGSLATGIGIEVGQSLQRAPAQEHVGDAGRFDVSDVVRTASGALVGMGVETAIGAFVPEKTNNPIYTVLKHITSFDIGKDVNGKAKVTVGASFTF